MPEKKKSYNLNHIGQEGSDEQRVAEAYETALQNITGCLEVELDPSEVENYDIYVGESSVDTDSPYVQLSNPENYSNRMSKQFSAFEKASLVFQHVNVPIHEVAESAAHLIAEHTQDGRAKETMSDLIVNEYFGGLGLGIEDPMLLKNDKEILKRNLELQQDFFSQEHVDYIADNLDMYRSVSEELNERMQKNGLKDVEDFASDITEELKSSLPSRLEDFEVYTWSHDYDVGTFSEFFLESYVVPGNLDSGDCIEREINYEDNLHRVMKENLDILDSLDKVGLGNLRDDVFERSSRNNRAYLISRVLAKESINRNRFDPTELIKMSNTKVWRRLESSASSLDKKIIDEFDIPSKNPGNLDVSMVGGSNAT